MSNYIYCPENEQKEIRAKNKSNKDGPAKGTRTQKAKAERKESAAAEPAVCRVEKEFTEADCQFTVQDGMATMPATSRCDDGADDCIASAACAERSFVPGIGKLEKIETVTLQVALKKGDTAKSFEFSRTCKVPRTIIHLRSGKMAFENVT